jgi:hypothetical protein
MERDVTALVTDSELSCEINLIREYAPKVMSGDRTKGVNAYNVACVRLNLQGSSTSCECETVAEPELLGTP